MKGFLSRALVFSFFLFSTFYFLSSATPAYATSQTIPTQSNTTVPPSNTNPNVPNNLHNWTQNVMIEVMSALTCQLAGVDPINPKQGCLGIDQASGKIGFLPSSQTGGAIGFMGNMITALYTPPLHTADYFQDLAQNFGITKSTYAQTTGTGFEGLRPLLSLWTVFRNFVYLVFVIVFIVIGLAIMLRVKIDPRTVMTIQNQIPKIIIGILLVTFSFAISGFLIDIMYVSIHLGGDIIASADNELKDSGIVTQLASETNPFQAAGHVGREGGNAALGLANIAWEPAKSVGGFISPIFDNTPGKLIVGLVMGVIGKLVAKETYDVVGGILTAVGLIGGTAVGGPVGAITGAAIGKSLASLIGTLAGATAGVAFAKDIVGGFISIIAFLIIAVALIAALFRLWFTLITSYIHILIDVVLSPFWIMGSIVPGSPINVSGWIRDLIANLAVFPATIFMFLLGKVFIDAFGTADKATQFVPPLIGNRASTDTIGTIIGLGIILITPNILTVIKTALKTPKFDTGLGKALAPGLAAPSRLIQVGLTKATMKESPSGFMVYQKGALGTLGRLLGVGGR